MWKSEIITVIYIIRKYYEYYVLTCTLSNKYIIKKYITHLQFIVEKLALPTYFYMKLL